MIFSLVRECRQVDTPKSVGDIMTNESTTGHQRKKMVSCLVILTMLMSTMAGRGLCVQCSNWLNRNRFFRNQYADELQVDDEHSGNHGIVRFLTVI